MRKKRMYWAVMLLVISVTVCFLARDLDIFKPEKKRKEVALKSKCDPEGVRKIRMTYSMENKSNGALHVYVTDCNDDNYSYHELVLEAKTKVIDPKLVTFEWKNMDTVIVAYSKKLKVSEKCKKPSTIKPKLVIEFRAE